jgi:hypothetical protein
MYLWHTVNLTLSLSLCHIHFREVLQLSVIRNHNFWKERVKRNYGVVGTGLIRWGPNECHTVPYQAWDKLRRV